MKWRTLTAKRYKTLGIAQDPKANQKQCRDKKEHGKLGNTPHSWWKNNLHESSMEGWRLKEKRGDKRYLRRMGGRCCFILQNFRNLKKFYNKTSRH